MTTGYDPIVVSGIFFPTSWRVLVLVCTVSAIVLANLAFKITMCLSVLALFTPVATSCLLVLDVDALVPAVGVLVLNVDAFVVTIGHVVLTLLPVVLRQTRHKTRKVVQTASIAA
jgi:hypothetical protein